MSIQSPLPGQEVSRPQGPHPRPGGGQSRCRTWAVVAGTSAVVALGLLMPAAASAATARHPVPATAWALPGGGTSTAPGGSLLGGHHRLPGADKATQLHMTFVNKTGQTLDLTNAAHSGTGTTWQNRAATTLAPGATGTASVYSAGDAQIDLTYTGASDSTVFKLHGITPLLGDNSASGSSSSASYTVAAKAGSGYNPTDNYTIEPGGTFNYTGQTVQYTVPVGVTQLKIEAIGGGTKWVASATDPTGGADVTGTAQVTPGETLLIGVAGYGGESSKYAGGWGMTYNGSNYSGGDVEEAGDQLNSQAGGGATVVVDSGSGAVIVVAGGGGGDGDVATDCDTGHQGGSGGQGGSWTGGNGTPFPGGGGQAGANTTSQGQASTAADDCAGGAGGGGVLGGLAGVDGAGAGGGAGSSAAAGLTGASITSADASSGFQNGEVIINAAS
jgi:hypothetical protein